MNLITLDFETYYDREYSLTKLTTEEYVRSPKFEVIGVAVKVNDGETQWASGTHDELKQWLQKSFDWTDSFVLAHNTMFDGSILAWRFGIHPYGWLDTLCMGRALHGVEVSGSLKALTERYELGAKGTEVVAALGKRRSQFSEEDLARYGDYCINDVELTYKLFNIMARGFPKKELKIIDLTLRMFIEPILELDKQLLEEHLRDVQARKEKLLTECCATVDELMSNQKFAEILRGLGVVPPTKVSPTTNKDTYAFAKSDEAFKALLEHHDPQVQAVVAARLGNKSTLEETRTERFIGIAERGALPVPIRYYAAHTGRFGGDDKINLQNLPSRGANANQLKRAIVAPKGHVVIDADSSQIEARVLAWLAGQDDLVEAFAEGKDVYKKMASAIYAKPEADITKEQRFVGKTTILGAGYGMGAAKFQLQLKGMGVEVELDEARRIIDIYRRTNPAITRLWRDAQNALVNLSRGDGGHLGLHNVLKLVPEERAIQFPSGLLMRYAGLGFVEGEKGVEFSYKTRNGRTRIYGGKCLAGDTEVLTDRGWVPLAEVKIDDRVWDGVEWVNHDGLTYQGEKHTIVIDGVRMTPDHKVLTEKGWQDASSCEGLRRAEVRLPDGHSVCEVGRSQVGMGVSVSLRGQGRAGSYRRGEVREAWGASLMRMHGGSKDQNPQYVQTPGVLGMALHAGPLSTAYTSGVAQLRSAWGYCVQAVAGVVRSILGRHGADVYAGVGTGSSRQQWAVFSGELPLDFGEGAGRQSQGVPARGSNKSTCGDGYLAFDARVSVAPEAVYDLLNAGPRSRFMVRGHAEPFVVHNCVENVCQGLARCIIAEQMVRIGKRYKVVLTVHDAIAVCVREAVAEEARAYVEESMRWVPDWAAGLPVNCESGMAKSYGDC